MAFHQAESNHKSPEIFQNSGILKQILSKKWTLKPCLRKMNLDNFSFFKIELMYSFEKILLTLNHEKFNRVGEWVGINKIQYQPGNKIYRYRGYENLIQRKVKP